MPLAFAQTPAEAVRLAAWMSRTTHAAPEAVDACRYLAGLIIGALQGTPKARLLEPRFAPAGVDWHTHPLSPQIDAIAAGRFKGRQPPAIRGTGDVVHALEAALWAFTTTETFREGLAGGQPGRGRRYHRGHLWPARRAYYGGEAIPANWRACHARAEEIDAMADRLRALSDRLIG